MENSFTFFAMIAVAFIIALAVVFGWFERKEPQARESIRRGTGHALFGLQQFIEPSVEFVVQAENAEQQERDDDQGLGGDEAAVRSDLAEALGRSPIDPEEVRRHLATAARHGLDWQSLFDDAVAGELRQKPFRAPSMPPARRVAPRV